MSAAWTATEIKLLYWHWGEQGIATMMQKTGRTREAIVCKARRLGIPFRPDGSVSMTVAGAKLGCDHRSLMRILKRFKVKVSRVWSRRRKSKVAVHIVDFEEALEAYEKWLEMRDMSNWGYEFGVSRTVMARARRHCGVEPFQRYTREEALAMLDRYDREKGRGGPVPERLKKPAQRHRADRSNTSNSKSLGGKNALATIGPNKANRGAK